MIARETCERVKEAATIKEVVEQSGVELKKSGADWLGLCPFHNERTPSFHVNPRRNRFKCFGCGKGGDPIAFVMEKDNLPYHEAVRRLAGMFHIPVKEEQREFSAKELAERDKVEQGRKVLEQVQRFFESQLCADSPGAKAAKAYAFGRWGEAFCKEAGLGYAPYPKEFFEWVKAENIHFQTLLDLGIVNYKDGGRHSFMFCNRVTIPVCDRWGHVTGFTARSLEQQPKCKYLNSTTSALFRKGEAVFGLDVARRASLKDDRYLYILEGAPDVLRMQMLGHGCAVAALGTQWTPEQFKAVKGIRDEVCFIPDSERPKEGEPYGPGFAAVMKNGQTALNLGLHVYVKEIPLADDEPKQDADSYFTDTEKFDAVEVVEFVPWYARQRLKAQTTEIERSAAIKDICRLLAAITDKTLADNYLEAIAKEHRAVSGSKSVWRAALKELRQSPTPGQEAKPTSAEDADLNRELRAKYGFFIAQNCYYDINAKGDETRLSNFILKPMYAIPDDDMLVRLFKMVNNLGQETMISLNQEEMCKLDKFRMKVNIAGRYVWLGKIDGLMKVEEYICENVEDAQRIRNLGWQPQGFFAYGDGIYTDSFLPVDEIGMVRVPDKGLFYLPAFSKIYRNNRLKYAFEKTFVYSHRADVTLPEFLQRFTEVFGDNGKVGIAFVFATLFRDFIFDSCGTFPIFCIYGKPQSGKSQLGKAMRGFFTSSYMPVDMDKETYAAMNKGIEQAVNVVFQLDEYKNSLPWNKISMLKSIFDGVSRGKMKDGEVERVEVNCGIILSGQEMPTFDPALFTRMALVSVNKTKYTLEERTRWKDLMDLCKQGVCHLPMQILQQRERFTEDFPHFCEVTLSEFASRLERMGKTVSDRMIMNWVVLLAAYRTVERLLPGMPFTYDDLLEVAIPMLIEQNEVIAKADEVGGFWDCVNVMFQENRLIPEADFRISRFQTSLKLKDGSTRQFPQPLNLLLIRDRRVIQHYQQERNRESKQIVLGSGDMRRYLMSSPQCLGLVKRRFYKVNQYGQVLRTPSEDGRLGLKQYDTDLALAFDYTALQEAYNIYLEAVTEPDSEEEQGQEGQKNDTDSSGASQDQSLPF